MIYILCYQRKLHHAWHYCGYAEDEKRLRKRVRLHAEGYGANITKEFCKAGIPFHVSRVMMGGRDRERQIKRAGVTKYCPVATGGGKFIRKNVFLEKIRQRANQELEQYYQFKINKVLQ